MSGRQLRAAMATGLVHAPGCYDALGAMLVEQAGFPAAYLSGFALSAASLGRPTSGCSDSTTSPRRCGGSRPCVDHPRHRRHRHRLRRPAERAPDGARGRGRRQRPRCRSRTRSPRSGAGTSRTSRIVDARRGGRARRRSPSSRAASADTVVIARTDAVAVDRRRRGDRPGAPVRRPPGPTSCSSRRSRTPSSSAEVAAALAGRAPPLQRRRGRPLADARPEVARAPPACGSCIHPITLLLETIRAQQAALGGAARRPVGDDGHDRPRPRRGRADDALASPPPDHRPDPGEDHDAPPAPGAPPRDRRRADAADVRPAVRARPRPGRRARDGDRHAGRLVDGVRPVARRACATPCAGSPSTAARRGTLDPALRELGQTRAGWLRGSQFVFSQHCKSCRTRRHERGQDRRHPGVVDIAPLRRP